MDLDTNVNQYLESFQIDDTWPDQPVTLRHIMTHTAGFEDGGVGYLIVSELVIDRTNNLVFFVSFGARGGGAVRSGFKPAFYDQYFPLSKPIPVPPSDFAERAEKYVGTIVLSAVGDQLNYSIPFAIKAWLVLPIIAFVAGLYHFYQAVIVWRGDLLGGIWARLRFTYVTLAGLFMCWFYWCWNFLGWQYMT